MALSYKVIAVGREPNNGRRYITVEMTFSGAIGVITKNVTHINPKDADFAKELKQYVKAFAAGVQAVRKAKQDQPNVPNLTPAEEAALIAVPADDADVEA